MKIFVILLTLFCYSTLASANIYVKDLHKKCLSVNQKCMRTCAQENQNGCTTENVEPKALFCAKQCLADYIQCEKDLDTMRCLIEQVPLLPKYKANFVPKELQK